MAPGQCAVTHESNPLRFQEVVTDRKETVSDTLLYPGENAVGDDIVKCSPGAVNFRETAPEETDIGKAKLTNHLLPVSDGSGCQIDADELAFWKTRCHRHEVAAIAAAQFKNTTMLHVGGFEAKERADDGQTVRMRLGMCVTGVDHHIVTGKIRLHFLAVG